MNILCDPHKSLYDCQELSNVYRGEGEGWVQRKSRDWRSQVKRWRRDAELRYVQNASCLYLIIFLLLSEAAE